MKAIDPKWIDRLPGVPLKKDDRFNFRCHRDLACFNQCCRNLNLFLYPYDVLRLKQSLNMDSDRFLEAHTETALRDNPYFPSVMLKMSEAEDRACTFLTKAGCTVYEDRPFSCRAYPLERGVGRTGEDGRKTDFYGIARHDHCKGHLEKNTWTVAAWLEDQGVPEYNAMNDLWVDIDTILRKNPWGDRGLQSPAFGMTFMASYNMDHFRRFVFESTFLSRFTISADRIEDMKTDDAALMP